MLRVPCGCDCRPKVELGAVRRKLLQRQAPTETAGRLDSEGDAPRATGCSVKKEMEEEAHAFIFPVSPGKA